VTIVKREHEHEEGLHEWRRNPERITAQKLPRQGHYAEYHVQVGALDLESKFEAYEATNAVGR